MSPSIAKAEAVYAGTFDPVTNGHCDVIERALNLFESLTVAVAKNPLKAPLLSLGERVELLQGASSSLENRSRLRIEGFDELLVDYARRRGARVIVRGLRAVSDYEYEAQMGLINRKLAAEIETIYLMTSQDYSFISSSKVREIALFGGDISAFVPRNVSGFFMRRRG